MPKKIWSSAIRRLGSGGRQESFLRIASQTETGAIIVHYRPEEIDFKNRPSNVAAIYARVSSQEKKSELDTQASRLIQYSSARGYQIAHVVKVFGCGISDSRQSRFSTTEKNRLWHFTGRTQR